MFVCFLNWCQFCRVVIKNKKGRTALNACDWSQVLEIERRMSCSHLVSCKSLLTPAIQLPTSTPSALYPAGLPTLHPDPSTLPPTPTVVSQHSYPSLMKSVSRYNINWWTGLFFQLHKPLMQSIFIIFSSRGWHSFCLVATSLFIITTKASHTSLTKSSKLAGQHMAMRLYTASKFQAQGKLRWSIPPS